MAIATPVFGQAMDPAIEWKMIDTPEATFIYDARHKKLAREYIAQFESFVGPMIQLFGEAPRRPTFLLINNTDMANGSAQVVPRPTVVIYPVVPAQHMSIGQFRDSAYEVTLHEYTHVLNMEPSHGIMVPLRYVFGSVARPNMMLPRWYTEGLAVYLESYYSPDGGRLHSDYLHGLVRAITLENKWGEYPLNKINDAKPDFVGGGRPYLMGGMLWETLIDDHGLKAIKTLNQNYSRRFPYFLNGPLQELYEKGQNARGVSYEDLLDKTYRRWSTKARKQIETVHSAPHIRGKRVYQKGFYSADPSISPNGKFMAYVNKTDKEYRGQIMLVRRHKKRGFRGYKPKAKTSGMGQIQTIAWHPKSKGFLFEAIGQSDRFHARFDLHFLEFYRNKNKKLKTRIHQLTSAESASHPVFSESGKTIYYVHNTVGGNAIRKMPFRLGKKKSKKKSKKKKSWPETLYEPPIGTQIFDLNVKDKNALIFIEQRPQEKRQIVYFDLATKQRKILLPDHQPGFLKNTPQGWIMGSNASGIQNIYLIDSIDLNPQLKAITNTQTHIDSADLDPINQELYYSEYTSTGPRLFTLSAAQWESLADTPPQVEPLVQLKGPARKPLNYEAANRHQEKEFSPWRYMVPNHWIPFVFNVPEGFVFQASTSAGDPLGINTIGLLGQWDTLTKRAGGSISYVNRSTPVGLGLSFSNMYSYFYPTEQTLESVGLSTLMSFRVPYSPNSRFNFRWVYSQLRVEGSQSNAIRQGPSLSYRYSNLRRGGNAISTESGWSMLLGHRHYLTELGQTLTGIGNRSYRETEVNLSTYWSSFTPGRSVFYLGVNGTLIPDDNVPFIFRTSTLAGPFNNVQTVNTSYLQRGYATGNFVAQNILNVNAEFRFPLWRAFTGFRSPPAFLRSISTHIVFDASTLDGSTSTAPTEIFDEWFTGYGAELHFYTQMGFHVPVSFTLGLYYGANKEAGGELTPFFAFQF